MMDSYHHADQVLRSPQGYSLYVGDVQAAEDLDWLKQNKVRTVITAASGFNFHYDQTIKHIVYDLQDKKTENASVYFDMAGLQIQKDLKKNGVLVHCGAGVSRSSTLVIAYMIKYKGMTFLQALKHLKARRPGVCPNLGFQLQLKSYQKIHTAPTNIFLLTSTKKRQRKEQLPDIIKFSPLHTTSYNQPFHNNLAIRHSNMSMSKSLKPVENRQKKEVEYLKKLAQFRFGITNMSKWRIGVVNKQLGY